MICLERAGESPKDAHGPHIKGSAFDLKRLRVGLVCRCWRKLNPDGKVILLATLEKHRVPVNRTLLIRPRNLGNLGEANSISQEQFPDASQLRIFSVSAYTLSTQYSVWLFEVQVRAHHACGRILFS